MLDLASAIIDISASGGSLVAHDLVPLHEIGRSDAVLIAHAPTTADVVKGRLIRRLLVRVRASLEARAHKYVVMNAPVGAVVKLPQSR